MAEPRQIAGQTFENRAILINGQIMSNPQISIPHNPYLLERYDFEKLINPNSNISNIAITLFGASIGLLINIIAKIVGQARGSTISIEDWEFNAFLGSLALTILLFVIDKFAPSKRKRVVRKINYHFELNSNNN